MQLTQRIRIRATPEQVDVLWHLSERCRLVYNFALSERIDAWKNQRKGIGYTKQQNDLPDIKEKYPEYQWVYSKVLQMALKSLDADYRSFFALLKNGDTNARPPRFKGKKHFCTLKYNQSGFKVEPGKVTLTHFYNDVPLVFRIPEKFRFSHVYQVDVSLDGEDFYLSIVYDVKAQEYTDNGLYQAWDLGISKQVGINLEGKFTEVVNPRPDKYWKKPIAEVQSRRDHCKKGSRKWKRLNAQKIRMERKRSNQLRDFQHKCSTKIVNNTMANTIIVGDLSVKSMPQSKTATKGINRATQGTGYLGRFAWFLTYKAERVGKKVIEISERKTSKTCCVCGKEHDMPIWKRTMECDCGTTIDRDQNSAINIMVRYLSQNAKWTGYQQFAGNLRNTGMGITPLHPQEAPRVSEA